MKDLHERYLLLHQSSERLPFHPLLRQKAQGKTRHESRTPLSPQAEKCTDPFYTHTHQATQNGMLMKFGLLKSGHLMN